jgi:hypothetical protein
MKMSSEFAIRIEEADEGKTDTYKCPLCGAEVNHPSYSPAGRDTHCHCEGITIMKLISRRSTGKP